MGRDVGSAVRRRCDGRVSLREVAAQGEPDGIDRTFPSQRPKRKTWFRAHRLRTAAPDEGCWFFASLSATRGAGGRFDLLEPHGTCYWADSELAAAREMLGRPGDLVDSGEVAGRVVTTAQFAPGRLADLLHTDASRRGVTAELGALVPYDLSRRWASAFHAAGFDGLRYQPRFSSNPAVAIAVFGAAGVPDPPPAVSRSRPQSDVLIANGYTVVLPPSIGSLGGLID